MFRCNGQSTIEAAQVKNADKGFVVMADEIKEPAKQTVMATGQIKGQDYSIQSLTPGTVTQIGSIATIVNQVNEIVFTIGAAIEEQLVT
ncbi:MAG: hypothetical protein GY874_02820 [Desulfobacteraceae bacterium]|nr:hypothetical protein [Desulfobacteraceae bacterium]